MSGTSGIRPARPEDVPDVLRLIHDLAAYEREPDAVRTSAADLRAALFPDDGQASAFCHVALSGQGEVVGIALWFLTFSTWEGRHGIWVEDLFVTPDSRGAGLGRALLAELARIAVDRGYRRLEWSVLDWNTPAIGFYRGLGAQGLDEWTVHRLQGRALQDLAAGRSPQDRAEPVR